MSRAPLAGRIWTRETVVAAIRGEARAGHDLSYSGTEKRVPSLLRAAERAFGSWRTAVEAAGFNYDDYRRYREWTREKVVARIQEWQAKGEDLSWRHVACELDPPLAAAALHGGRFASWNDALAAAGLNPDEIMRYQRWTIGKVREELERAARLGISLDQTTLAQEAPALLAAVYRHGAGLVAERTLTELRQSLDELSDADELGEEAYLPVGGPASRQRERMRA